MSKKTNKKNAITEEKREKVLKAVEDIEKTPQKQTQSKPKQLTMAQVKREAVKTNKMAEYTLSTDEAIRHYPIFPQGKINEMLKEYQDQIQYATKKDILIPEEKTLDYIYFLCIKYFTSLKKGISDKYENQLLQMEHLIDAGYFKEIVNDVFMQSEINKVLDAITDLLSTFQLLENIDVQLNRKTEDLKVRNKDIINVLADPYGEVANKH